jgi:nicotinamide riboside kinase
MRVEVVEEQGRLLAQRLPPGHPWSWREQRATSLMHRAAEAAAEVVLAAGGAGVLLADGTTATPLVWHLCAVRRRPGYDAGPPDLAEELVTPVEQAPYDLVLLTAPDLPWEPDGIRDDPQGRDEAFEQYCALYPQAVVIRGDQRLPQATRAVSALLPTDR